MGTETQNTKKKLSKIRIKIIKTPHGDGNLKLYSKIKILAVD